MGGKEVKLCVGDGKRCEVVGIVRREMNDYRLKSR